MTLKALFWDVDGTLAETERDGHRVAFNRAFEAQGLGWRWSIERYGELLAVTGGRERLLHDMVTQTDAPTLADEREALAQALHQRKNAFYADIVGAQGMPLREGVRELMDECRSRGVLMGITTTTSRSNVQALLRAHLGTSWTSWFAVLVCGEDVASKKPDPEVFSQALERLNLSPLEAVALEDSPGGVAAACAAEVPVVVTRSAYFHAATLESAVAIGPGLGQRTGWRPQVAESSAQGRIGLDDIIDWCQRMEHTSQFG